MIISEYDDLIFINKPANISSLDERDMNAVSIIKLAKKFNPSCQLCHRLDKETSGVLVIAKNPEAYKEMAMKFENREVEKYYHAIVEGALNVEKKSLKLPLSITKKGTAKIDMRDGKMAETEVTSLRIFKHHTLLECKPVTGRLHQIRIHLASQNFPIVSDLTYGGHMPLLSKFKNKYKTAKFEEEQTIMKRVALHAFSIRFEFGGKLLNISAPYPNDFTVLLKLLDRYDM